MGEEETMDLEGSLVPSFGAVSLVAALRRLAAVALLATGLACAHGGAGAPATATPSADAARVLLVRHAEAVAGVSDPELTAAGERRAAALADLLADEGIDRVLATDTRRARATAQPIAERLGLAIEIYDPRRLGDLAEALRAGEGTVLVVGHSNTTPELVRLLGGDPGEPIGESEHDRLYRVDPRSGATAMERYAVP
jgi:phosphohistidine phosphatase SixA